MAQGPHRSRMARSAAGAARRQSQEWRGGQIKAEQNNHVDRKFRMAVDLWLRESNLLQEHMVLATKKKKKKGNFNICVDREVP